MTMNRFLFPVPLAAACLALTNAAHAATPFDTTGTFVQYTVTSGAASVVTQFSSDWVTANGSSASYSAAIQGLGQVGTAKFAVTASGIIGDNVAVGGWAGWNDQITFNSPSAAAGSTGIVTLQLAYSWAAGVIGSAYGEAFVDINLKPTVGTGNMYANVTENITHSCTLAGQCGSMESFASGAGAIQPTWANGIASFQFNVQFGKAYTLVVGMNTAAYSNAAGSSILVDATHSLNWNGITAVTAGGVAVPYTATALSGTNYALPVPEVPPLAMWAAGLAALAAVRRTRRR